MSKHESKYTIIDVLQIKNRDIFIINLWLNKLFVFKLFPTIKSNVS